MITAADITKATTLAMMTQNSSMLRSRRSVSATSTYKPKSVRPWVCNRTVTGCTKPHRGPQVPLCTASPPPASVKRPNTTGLTDRGPTGAATTIRGASTCNAQANVSEKEPLPLPKALSARTGLMVADFYPMVVPACTAVGALALLGMIPGVGEVGKALLCSSAFLVYHIITPITDIILGERPFPTTDNRPTATGAPVTAPSAAPLTAQWASESSDTCWGSTDGGHHHSKPGVWQELPALLYCALYFSVCLLCYKAAAAPSTSAVQLALLSVSLGVASTLGIIAGHELLHSRNHQFDLLEQILFARLWWWPFYRSHMRHHHLVGTPDDHASAWRDETYYTFLPRYLAGYHNIAWKYGVEECKAHGHRVWSLHNRTLVGLGAQVLLSAAVLAAFGPAALMVHLASAAWGVWSFSMFEYVLHYGMVRPKLGHDHFASINTLTSLSSHYLMEALINFKATLHGAHHTVPHKHHTQLTPTHQDVRLPVPLLVGTYSCLIPPLWFRMATPLIEAANAKNKEAEMPVMG